MRNEAVALPVLRRPELDVAAYDVAIEVDASLTAWGAVVLFPRTGRMVRLQQRWTAPISHSAHAEPRAALCAMQWARSQPGYANARVALITDHVAIATGQKRWYSANGGFSTSYFLNECFKELYEHGGGEVFHVDGERNEADQLSRDPHASTVLSVTPVNVAFRSLASVRHPHRVVPRQWYQV